VKIFLDENMPESLAGALENLGHEVDSVNNLKLRQMRDPSPVKALRVVVPQQRVESFIPAFIAAFQRSDWSHYSSGDDWP
jgi:hypothetical protein